MNVGLPVFMDYANAHGFGRMSLVRRQRRRIQDPSRPAFIYYGAAIGALSRAFASTDPEADLDLMVDRAMPTQERHYAELRDGMLEFLGRKRISRVPVARGVWETDDLRVTVRQHVGVRLRNGQQHVVLLYLKEPPLSQGAADAALRIMESVTSTLLPDATPRVLDVRRGRLMALRANASRPQLDGWLRGEAAGYVAHWEAAAA
ncbi:MAG TPA: hypothetical protein VGD67_02960 [Pseudonocardiaceae bacterium]